MTRPPNKPEPQTDNNKASVLNRIEDALREYYIAPFRQSIGRAQRDEDDLFMLLVMAETLGIPNPTTYYTLELLPIIYDRFHEWHKRMGMERSPLDHVHCC
ncbi:cory-CC-star protein [Aurantivibrio plasticivorans]